MNNTVSVTGMQVKAIVNDNLLIAETTPGDTDGEAESAYKKAITTSIKAILEPASTVNGVKYYYTATDNVVGSGDARADQYTPYKLYDSETFYGTKTIASGDYADEFSKNYGVTSATVTAYAGSGKTVAEAYKDYAFYIKATNTASSTKEVRITTLDLTYGLTGAVAHKAFRAAIFADTMTSATAGAHDVDGSTGMTLVSILKPDNAVNFTANSAVSSASAVTEIASAKRDQNAVIGSVTSGATTYFKVVIRLWLEGEDKTCNNDTFAKLTDTWSLDVVLKMDGTTAAVNKLGLIIPTGAKADLSSASLDSDTRVIDNVTYTKIATVTLNSQDLYVEGTSNLSSTSRIFIITADGNPLEVTNQCTLPAAP